MNCHYFFEHCVNCLLVTQLFTDTVLTLTVHNTIQISIHDLIKWTELNHVSLHPSKAKWMLITTRQKRQSLTVMLLGIRMHSKVVEEMTIHKVLGVIINKQPFLVPSYCILM